MREHPLYQEALLVTGLEDYTDDVPPSGLLVQMSNGPSGTTKGDPDSIIRRFNSEVYDSLGDMSYLKVEQLFTKLR